MARLNVPDVPYQAYPSEVPQGQLPALSVRTDPAAFGANVAAAVQHMGGQLENVGGELFARAIQMQQIKNETEASNAANAFTGDASEKAEKFKTQLGMSAQDGLKAFNDDLIAHHDKIRGNLSNPAVQRAYDGATRGVLRQYMSQASGHAATEFKRASVASLDAQEKLNQDRLEKAPNDAALTKELEDTRLDIANKRQQLLGWDENVKKLYLQNSRDQELGIRARGIGDTDPDKGYEFLKEHKKEMSSETYLKAQEHLDNKLNLVVGRNMGAAANSFPDGTGAAAWLHQDQISILQSVDRNVSEVFNRFTLNHPEFRAVPTAGELKSLDYMARGDMEATLKGLQEAADEAGVKILIEHDEDHVSFKLDPEQDPATVPRRISEPPDSRAGRVQAVAAEDYPDHPRLGPAAWTHTMTGYRQIVANQRAAENQANIRMYEFVSPADNKPRPHNEDELRQQLMQAYGNTKLWDNLNPKQQATFRKIMSSPHAIRNNDHEWWRLNGLLDEGDLATVTPDLIINSDQLTSGSKHELLKKWQRVAHGEEGNPMVNKAIDLIRNDQPKLDIWKNDEYSREQRAVLKGVLQDVLMAHGTLQQGRAKPQEIIDLGRKLLQQVHLGFFSGDVFEFERPITDAERSAEKANSYWDNRVMNDELVDRKIRINRALNLDAGKEMLPPGTVLRPPEEAVQTPMPTVPTRPPSVAGVGGRLEVLQRQEEAIRSRRAFGAQSKIGQAALSSIEKERAALQERGGEALKRPSIGVPPADTSKERQAQLEALDREEKAVRARTIGGPNSPIGRATLARIERERKALKGE